jgi:hypothetical protein
VIFVNSNVSLLKQEYQKKKKKGGGNYLTHLMKQYNLTFKTKNKTREENYRFISPMNTKMKILTKIPVD